jgi:BlaI family transcriptional regulator, penicillinase repressor
MPPLTPGELKVMRLLWEHGEMKPADLQGRFLEPIKNPALRFYLTTLLEKGHVTRRKVGKAYFYKPATRARSVFGSMLAEFVDAYCGGSIQTLVLNIITSEKLCEDDLLKLKRLADLSPDVKPRSGRSRK